MAQVLTEGLQGCILQLKAAAERSAAHPATHAATHPAPPAPVKYHTPSTRMEIRTWRSAIADLKTSPPGTPSGALGEGNPGWVWRCDAAISRYKEKTCLFGRFFTCSQNIKMTPFSLIPKVFGHV